MASVIRLLVAAAIALEMVEGIKVYTFHPDGETSDTGSVELVKTFPEFTSMTTCLRFFPLYFRNTNVVIALKLDELNQMHMEFGIQVLINGLNLRYKFSPISRRLLTKQWYHWCFLYDHSTSTFSVVLDGTVLSVYNKTTRGVMLSDRVILGRYDYKNSQNVLSGKLSQVNLWSRVLSFDEIRSVSTCQTDLQGDVISWDDENWVLINATEETVNMNTLCALRSAERSLYLFEPRTFAESVYICEGIGGHLSLPRTQEEMEEFAGYIAPYKEQCWEGRIWAGGSDAHTEGKWIEHYNGQIIQNPMWGDDEPNGYTFENCMVNMFFRFQDFNCFRKFCFICVSDFTPSWAIFGSCEVDDETKYFSSLQTGFGDLSFQGYSSYMIELKNNTWTWMDIRKDIVLARLIKFPGEYYHPMGRKVWEIEESMCGQKDGRRVLLLTSCPDNFFTCSDGTCIPILERCDLKYDCKDLSDENDCFVVQFPEDYATDLPPRPTDASTERESGSSGPLEVHMDLVLERIDIETTSMLMDSTFNLTFTWYDNRLIFRNLKEASYLNQLSENEEQKIWSPAVTFKNSIGRKRSIKDVETYMTVLNNVMSKEINPKLAEEAQLFEGAYNPVIMSRVYSAVITCDFDLVLYPFDVQRCSMNMEMLSTTKSYLVFGNQSKVSYTGSTFLIEYEVGVPKLYSIQFGAYSNIVAEVPFARRLGYALLNIYTPSLILLIIAYSTLFYRLDIFEVRVMTSLTSLLVMATLFSQVSDSLPKTSYFKMVDVWLLFCIISTFLVIIFHAVIDIVYHNTVNPQQRITKVSPISSSSEHFRTLAGSNGNNGSGWSGFQKQTRSRLTQMIFNFLNLDSLNHNHLVRVSHWVLMLVFTIFNILYWGLVFLYRKPMEPLWLSPKYAFLKEPKEDLRNHRLCNALVGQADKEEHLPNWCVVCAGCARPRYAGNQPFGQTRFGSKCLRLPALRAMYLERGFPVSGPITGIPFLVPGPPLRASKGFRRGSPGISRVHPRGSASGPLEIPGVLNGLLRSSQRVPQGVSEVPQRLS
ncbi:uncharacterized protein LOC143019399 [Oratosquilla oratoria]|uniref:uncharacterized protein LOC143019399 n=1 Tax=Oratosquilla oratoria TaxID=337810 RepID=UPI003F768FC3